MLLLLRLEVVAEWWCGVAGMICEDHRREGLSRCRGDSSLYMWLSK